MARVAVLGTGMAGYGAWHVLRDHRHGVVLYDKNAYPGGHTTSWTFPPGFTFDEGPHVSFTKDERVQGILADAVDGEYEEIQYALDNYWRGHWVTHPAQCNLYGLPVEVVTKVIADFVAQLNEPERPIHNYEEWLVASYGRAFAEEFPAAYTRKYHTTPPSNMTTDWIGPRMYRPSLEEVLLGALAPAAPNVHYVTGFRYPDERRLLPVPSQVRSHVRRSSWSTRQCTSTRHAGQCASRTGTAWSTTGSCRRSRCRICLRSSMASPPMSRWQTHALRARRACSSTSASPDL